MEVLFYHHIFIPVLVGAYTSLRLSTELISDHSTLVIFKPDFRRNHQARITIYMLRSAARSFFMLTFKETLKVRAYTKVFERSTIFAFQGSLLSLSSEQREISRFFYQKRIQFRFTCIRYTR